MGLPWVRRSEIGETQFYLLCLSQIPPDTPSQTQSKPSTEGNLRMLFRSKQTQSNNYALKILETTFIRSKVHADLLTLQDHYQHQLFHLTITWINALGSDDPAYVNQTFTPFYIQELCPYLLQVHRANRFNRYLQPVTAAFIETGDPSNKNRQGNCALLHHHVLIAAKGSVAQRLHSICGLNTLKKALVPSGKNRRRQHLYADQVCTSDLKQITNHDVQIPYASKHLWHSGLDATLTFNYPVPWEMFHRSAA